MLLKTWRALVLMACMLVATTSAHSASKTLLVLGDSLSAEYGLARGTGWVPLLEKRLQDGKLNVKVVNASISGDTTSGGRARLQPLLDKHKPDVMVLELGANDALRGLPIASTEDNLQAMISAAQKIGAKVVLVGDFCPSLLSGLEDTRHLLRRHHAGLVDNQHIAATQQFATVGGLIVLEQRAQPVPVTNV